MRVESYLECGVGLALLAHPDVLHVMEQALRVVWVDDAGRRHAHWLDFVVILRDGRRIGVLVKPEALTRRSNVDVVALGIAAVGRRYGLDGVMVLTDRVVNRDRVTDARLINTARRHADPEADAALASIVATVNGPTAISVLVTRTGLGERAYRALVRSLATGNLELISSDRINADALVDRPASQGRAGA